MSPAPLKQENKKNIQPSTNLQQKPKETQFLGLYGDVSDLPGES